MRQVLIFVALGAAACAGSPDATVEASRYAAVAARCPASAPPAVVPVASPPAPRDSGPPSLRDIAERASRYTVFLRSGGAYGAGVVFDQAGHILTCDHVVLADTVEVHFEGKPPVQAKVAARDPELDLALLELSEPPPQEIQPATAVGVGGITYIQRGDEVYSMGAPRKMRFSFHRGVVSFVGRRFDKAVYLQTDLAMSPGSSGGPILDQQGRLIGIATFILRNSEGLSFALPIDYALRRFAILGSELRSPQRQALLADFESWLQKKTDDVGGAATWVHATDAPPAAR